MGEDLLGVLLTSCLALLGAAGPALAQNETPRPALTSSAFRDGDKIPALFTCEGENVSPPLSWDDLPAGTKSLAITLDDPGAPAGDWVHWVLYDVPPTPAVRTTGIGAGTEGRTWGVDSFSKNGYQGPCPPPGKPHRYVFTLYALSRPTGLKPGATRPQLLAAIKATTLVKVTLTGLFGRK